VAYNDPHIPELHIASAPHAGGHAALHLTSRTLTPELLWGQDCVLVVTDHSAYDWDWVVEHARLVVDTRNATARVRQGRERVVRA
jgi:UDP-N-acetyl-D-glucosamine dehydrogenase